MTKLNLPAVLLCFFLLSSAHAQVTNLHMNHGGTTFSMTSGDTLRWEYDVPAGTTVDGDVWLDANGNGVIDPDSDALISVFIQRDGDIAGAGGYPDLDGAQDGHVLFFERAGLPSGKYILRFILNSAVTSGMGTVAALASPAHIISGIVTPPPGKSARFILVQLERAPGYGQIFWSALTDATGAYTIAMNNDTAGNPWQLRIAQNPYQPSFVTPAETLVTVIGNPANYNFSILNPTAIVKGYLTDDGTALKNSAVILSRLASGTDSVAFSTNTDTSGLFQVPIRPGTLSGSPWQIRQPRSGHTTTTTMLALGRINSISEGDTVYYNLIAFRTNATIGGRMLVDGLPPDPQIFVFATSVDVAEAYVRTNPETGDFLINVSDKFTSYSVHPDSVIAQLYHVGDMGAVPGDDSIFINVSTTSVHSSDPDAADHFLLEQNYPNPFNPTTNVTFQVPPRPAGGSQPGFVSLKVFDLLGRTVSTIVSEELAPGRYTRTWDAPSFPPGYISIG